jgi:nucleotide-binding universal stress UspA family protein
MVRDGALVTVGFDGSRCARRALDWASAELAGRRGTVRVVACYSVPVTAEPWYVPAQIDLGPVADEARRLACSAADALGRTHPSVRFETVAALGPASDQLVAEAAGSDLLVVGTHGHGPLDAWRLGSVSHRVVRHATCPVAVVPDREPGPTRGRVVVGVDSSPSAAAALAWACDEADDRDDELLVVHAWDYPYATELGSPTARDLTQVDAALQLEAAVRTARDRRRGPVEDRLVQGRTAFQLIEEARDADLVVVGSRGRGAVRSLLFGSVAQEVSARASCPTVIVNAPPQELP